MKGGLENKELTYIGFLTTTFRNAFTDNHEKSSYSTTNIVINHSFSMLKVINKSTVYFKSIIKS